MKKRFVLVALSVLLSALPLAESGAQGRFVRPIAVPDFETGTITSVAPSIETEPLGKLIEYNAQEPLDNQMPLILIHGIGAENAKYYHWAHFLAYADKHPEFQKKFKIYFFRYETNYSVPELSAVLRTSLREFIKKSGEHPFRVLAYSEGGILFRNAMQDPLINAYTDKVITVATPFHGSPLANPTWLKAQLKETSVFSPVRMSNKLSYWIAHKRYPSFEADFQWDNFDTAISNEDYTRGNGRGELKGYLAEYSNKLITYGSFFGVDIDPDQQLPKALGLETPLPSEKPRFRNPFSKHFMFSLIRNNISAMPLAYWAKKRPQPETQPLPENQPLMVYNDGISPISSTLWLGRFTPEFRHLKAPTAKLWSALKTLKGTHVARLFPGLDHRDWMDGSTRNSSPEIKDLLNPEESSKTVFEWFIHDLMS